MFWKRTTTVATAAPSSSPGELQAAPIVRAVPLASVADAAITNTPAYTPPYEAAVPVPVASVTEAGMANVATADRTYQPDVRRSYTLVRISNLVWLLAGVLETLFAIRVILKLIAANQAAGFAQFITNTTAPFLAPFVGLTRTPAANGSALEVTTLIAMAVYVLLAWGIVKMIWIVFERRVAR